MAPIDIRDTFGTALVGALLTMILYGITTLQTYIYFARYPKDPRWTKTVVSSLWVLDTFHISLVSHAIYHYLILNFDNPSGLISGVWSLYLSIGVNIAIAFITQCFFTNRLHGLSGGKWWITAPILVTVIAHACFGIETIIELYQKEDFSRLSQITYIAAVPFAAFAVLSDILITLALCILLHNSRSGFRSTNSMINLIIVYAINRCLLTSIVAIVEMITFMTAQQTMWYLAADFVIGKLYANSLLATLNSRSSLADKGMADDESTEMTDASLHIGRVTQSVAFNSRTFPSAGSKLVDDHGKTKNEVVSTVSLVNGSSPEKKGSSTRSKLTSRKSKESKLASRGSPSSAISSSATKRSESEGSQELSYVSGSSGVQSGAGPSGSGNSGRSRSQQSMSSKSRSPVPEASHSRKESTSDGDEARRDFEDESESRSELEPPAPRFSALSATHTTYGSSISRSESEKVQVSVRSVVQTSSSSASASDRSAVSAAKASTVDQETHMIDL